MHWPVTRWQVKGQLQNDEVNLILQVIGVFIISILTLGTAMIQDILRVAKTLYHSQRCYSILRIQQKIVVFLGEGYGETVSIWTKSTLV